jgi:hypothetical protein
LTHHEQREKEAAARLAHVVAVREGPPPGSVVTDPAATSAVGESPNGSATAGVDTLAAAAAAPAGSDTTAATSTTAAVSDSSAATADADTTTAGGSAEVGTPATAAAVAAVSVTGGEDGEIVDLTDIKPKPAPPAIVPSDVVMLGFSDSSSSSNKPATGAASAADAVAAAVGVESLTLQRHNGRGLGLSKPPLRLNEHGEPEVCLYLLNISLLTVQSSYNTSHQCCMHT